MKEQPVRDRITELELVSLSQHEQSAVPICLTDEFADNPPAAKIVLTFRENAFGAVAADAAAALTNLAASASRRLYKSGETATFYRNTPLVWFVSSDGGTDTDAIEREIYRSVEE